MQIYWIKAQAPRRVLALVKHLGLKAEFVEVDMMGGGIQDAGLRRAQSQYESADAGRWRPRAMGGLGDHGPSLHQTGIGHVAGI